MAGGIEWTTKEVANLEKFYLMGMRCSDIALEIGKPVKSIYNKVSKMGLARELSAEREVKPVIVSKRWDAFYEQGHTDFPRMNAPNKSSLYEYGAYMAGYNDRDMGYSLTDARMAP